tara:strand:- start:9 stop:449 length:441 start_codon:yes stop_codon:yes gene_type:complete
MKISKELEVILLEGIDGYKNSGYFVQPYEKWLDQLHLNPVMFHGTPNSFAKKNYKKNNDWQFSFSDEFFYNCITKIDNKLRGKMWSVIEKIKVSPNTIMGNTIKPLKGNLKNLWRYRIGDWRIIYHPDTEHNTIVILNLSHRKNAY